MEFILIFTFYPMLVAVLSAGIYRLTKRWYIAPLLTAILFTILALTVYENFFGFVVFYIFISFVVSIVFKQAST